MKMVKLGMVKLGMVHHGFYCLTSYDMVPRVIDLKGK